MIPPHFAHSAVLLSDTHNHTLSQHHSFAARAEANTDGLPQLATDSTLGVIFRSMIALFEHISGTTSLFEYDVCMNVMEVYNGAVYDLLAAPCSGVERHSQEKVQVRVTKDVVSCDCVCVRVSSAVEAMCTCVRAAAERKTSSHARNQTSSRGHVITRMCVRRR